MISYIHQYGYVFRFFYLTAEFAEIAEVMMIVNGFYFSAFSHRGVGSVGPMGRRLRAQR